MDFDGEDDDEDKSDDEDASDEEDGKNIKKAVSKLVAGGKAVSSKKL
jgi:hypothetical protein